jgi:hypothetical protein
VRRARIEVHIEELVLDGFSALDRHAVADAVRRELTIGISERDSIAPSSRDRVDAGEFDAPPFVGADTLGTRVAQQVGKALR